MLAQKSEAGPLSERPGHWLTDCLSMRAITNRGDQSKMPNHPRQSGELKLSTAIPLRLGSRSFRSRRGGVVGGSRSRCAASGLGRSAAAAFGRSTTARFAAATTAMAMTAKQLELATTATARAATARLSGATARLFDNRATARRLFDRSGAAARGLDCRGTSAASFGRTTTATATAAEMLEEGVGLAFQGDRRNHQRHHTKGGLHCKILVHHNSSN